MSAKIITSNLRIFAGLCIWKNPAPEEMEIRAVLKKGEIAHGTLVAPQKEKNHG